MPRKPKHYTKKDKASKRPRNQDGITSPGNRLRAGPELINSKPLKIKPEKCALDCLPFREQQFVLIYVMTWNAKRAAMRAGYSPTSAHVQGCKLLKKPKVKAAIDEVKAEYKESYKADAEALIQKLVALCGVTMDEFVDTHGNLLPFSKVDPVAMLAVKEYDAEKRTIKITDRAKWVELLGKNFGIYVERHKVEGGLEGNLHVYVPSNGRGKKVKEGSKA